MCSTGPTFTGLPAARKSWHSIAWQPMAWRVTWQAGCAQPLPLHAMHRTPPAILPVERATRQEGGAGSSSCKSITALLPTCLCPCHRMPSCWWSQPPATRRWRRWGATCGASSCARTCPTCRTWVRACACAVQYVLASIAADEHIQSHCIQACPPHPPHSLQTPPAPPTTSNPEQVCARGRRAWCL